MTPKTSERPTTARSANRTEPPRRRPPPRSSAPARIAPRRRRLALLAVLLVACVAATAVIQGIEFFGQAVQEVFLPLRHEDIIRQQAADKDLDPALVAAVIYQESKFRDQTSSAGAKGLMQILPGTARYIARKSGGTEFEVRDLATPQVNISYGAWYLRYLREKYDGNETLTVAAYNAGERNVDRWVAQAGGPESFDAADIPFPETRGYLLGVRENREAYRETYSRELGL